MLEYIQQGESKGFNRKPTCASRHRWYDLGSWQKPDLLWSDAYNNRYAIYDASDNWADKRFFFIYLNDKGNHDTVLSYLNSSMIPLLIEIDGITNLGEGAIYTNVYQVKSLFVPSHIETSITQHLQTAFLSLCKRPIGTVFNELGAAVPEEVALDKVKPDRRELDKIIMGDILGLTDDEQLEVYRAVIDLVKSRLDKAKSLGDRKRTKEGIDIELLVKTVMDKIGDATLGNFYESNALNQKSLTEKTLPKHSYEINVKQSLLGWRLYSGDEYIECASETEANYLQVWLEAGLDKINVPYDEKYLAKIMPELQKLKTTIDGKIESQVGFITNPKTREKILHLLWHKICAGIND